MLNIENIKSTLATKGIAAENIEVTKNGAVLKGIRIIGDSCLSPVIYFTEDETEEEFITRVEAVVQQDEPSFDLDILRDPVYVAQNVYLTVQRKSDEDVLKRPCLNLDLCVRLRVDLGTQTGSIKVSKDFIRINRLDVTEDQIWDWAVENTAHQFEIHSMAEMMGMLCGYPDIDEESPFYVVTTKDSVDGASALYYPDFFWGIAHRLEKMELYILPSSRDELLIVNEDFSGLPDGRLQDVQGLAELVQTVNLTEVDETCRLDPVVYRYDIMDNALSIAATASQGVIAS